jgi:hypothetical protein
MDGENLSELQVDRADPSDWAALAKIDSVAAAGDHTRRDNIRHWCEQGAVLMARDSSGPLGYSVLEYSFFEQGFVTMLMVAPSARRRGVGACLLTAVETVCTTTKLFTSTNVSNHPCSNYYNAPAGTRSVCSTASTRKIPNSSTSARALDSATSQPPEVNKLTTARGKTSQGAKKSSGPFDSRPWAMQLAIFQSLGKASAAMSGTGGRHDR